MGSNRSGVERTYELLLASGKVATWVGDSPDDASRRYVNCVGGELVVAWRHADRHGIYEGVAPICEPGETAIDAERGES